MDQTITNNNNNLNLLNESNYLVTQAVCTSSLPQQKLSSDLEQLEQAESKTEYRTNIAKGVKNPQISMAMQALKLANPFKGY